MANEPSKHVKREAATDNDMHWCGIVWRTVLVLGLVVAFAMGCARGSNPVDAAARPIVERLRDAPVPTRWSFRYQPDSASDYLACLRGVDVVFGVMDLEVGALMVQPERNAPAIIVTESGFVVAPDPTAEGPWQEVRWNESDDPRQLESMFGEVLAGYIATGLRAPDLNMTTLAAIRIAGAVEVTTPPTGLSGDTLRITVDPDEYLAELESQGAATVDATEAIPTLIATVDDAGRVVALAVDARPADESADGHGTRYFLTAGYDGTEPLSLSGAAERSTVPLNRLGYPSPEDSCQF